MSASKQQLFCAPVRDGIVAKDHTCYTREELLKFVKEYNEKHAGGSGRIMGASRMTKTELVKSLDAHMTPMCGANQQWCWAEKLRAAAVPVDEVLRPVKPSEWKKDPHTWLSNFDIEKVMKQYEDDKRFRYKLMGVYPMDFAKVYPEVRAIDIAALRRDGRDYLGYILNLDNHDEPGSHWVSLFLCVNPDQPAYGAYFYDSVGTEPAQEIHDFLASVIQPQCQRLYEKPLPFYWNKRQNQRRNTECGVFSMNFQIKLLRKLLEKPTMSVRNIVKIKADDKKVSLLRDILFRPTTQPGSTYLGGRGRLKQRSVKEKKAR